MQYLSFVLWDMILSVQTHIMYCIIAQPEVLQSFTIMQANTQMTSVLEISVQHQQLLATCKKQKFLKNQLLGGSAKLETADIHHPKEILT